MGEEAAKKAAEEAESRRIAEEEAVRRSAEEEAVRKAEEEAAKKAAQMTEARGVAAPKELVIEVYIERELGFKTSVCVKEGSTIADVRNALAADDPTGQARVEDI